MASGRAWTRLMRLLRLSWWGVRSLGWRCDGVRARVYPGAGMAALA